MNIIGIDPGLTGAIAIIQDGEIYVHDMPTLAYTIANGKTRKEMDIARFSNIVRQVPAANAYVEALNGRPGRGATEFRIGENYGMIKASLALNGKPYNLVSPQAWKSHYGLKKLKGMTSTEFKTLSRKKAMEKFPDRARLFSRKKDDGRAEAALIALYGLELQDRLINQTKGTE